MTAVYLGLLIIAVGVAVQWAKSATQRLRWQSILDTLTVLVGQNLPLVAGLRSAAEAETGRSAKAYLALVEWLERGCSLSEALSACLPVGLGMDIGTLRAAEQAGTLSAVLRGWRERARRRAERDWSRRTPLLYFLVMLAIVPIVLLYFLLLIIPKFKEVFADYGQPMPALTEQLISFSSTLWLETPTVLCLLGLVVGLGLGARLARRSRFFGQASWPVRVWDGLVWILPGGRRLAELEALSRQMALLAAGVRAGHDLPLAARQAAGGGVNFWANRRLLRWAAWLEAGMDSPPAALRAGLPGALAAALRTATRPEDLAGALEYLACYYQGLAEHRERVVSRALAPLVVLAWGLIVGTIVVAFYLPLVAMNEGIVTSIA